MYSVEKRIILLTPSRTAGASIAKAIGLVDGSPVEDLASSYLRYARDKRKSDRNPSVVITVRDPYRRLVSLFFHTQRTDREFAAEHRSCTKFLEEEDFPSFWQTMYLWEPMWYHLRVDPSMPDFDISYIHMENLEQDYLRFIGKVQRHAISITPDQEVNPAPLSRTNQSSYRQHPCSYYSHKAYQNVRRAYAGDFWQFGYHGGLPGHMEISG